MAQVVTTAVKRLESALDAFQATLEDPRFATLRSTLKSTTSSDLNMFLQQQDECRQPSLNLVVSLSPITKVFELTYKLGYNICGLDGIVLQQFYGSLRCVLWVGHNAYKDMPMIARLLEEIGRSIQCAILEGVDDQGSVELWNCVSIMCAEIVRLCTTYITQGPATAEKHASTKTLCYIRDAQNSYSITQTQALLIASKKIEIHDKIYKWLLPPDPSSNFHGAIKQRQANTGLWLLDSRQFARWKITGDSLLWLYGKPGCGKTLLSSTVIENITKNCQNNTTQAVAYFYFAFTDNEKQKTQNMMRSVITQLSLQCKIPLKAIEDLFSTCGNGQRPPSPDTLMKLLRLFINGFDETFIILDALDECEDRGELLQCLEEILRWRLGILHIMVTSRPEQDVKDFFEPLLDHDQQICIQTALVNDDIRAYVRYRIQNDAKLKRWKNRPDVQREIEKSLMERVDGMFRWAVCQLDALVTCLNLPRLRAALASLPQTLDETYARILRNISLEYQPDALKILQWLVYSARPLRLEEVVEVLATVPNSEPRFDPDRRFPEPHDILSICSSLATIEVATHNVIGIGEIEVQELRLAHFSVKEYLISDRVCEEAKIYRISEISANAVISETCLAYLLQFDTQDALTIEVFRDFPLFRYSAEYWMQHARVIDQETNLTVLLAMELFLLRRNAYISWSRCFNPDSPWTEPELTRSVNNIAPPLYYVSFAGLYQLVQRLLEKGTDVNAQGGYFGSALQAASAAGHDAIVQQLLEKGADVNAQGGDYGNALQAASGEGHDVIVQQLLEKGADINAQGGRGGNALQAASARGHDVVVQQLLEKGADINAQGGFYGNALQAASAEGHDVIVQQLLEKGADINAQGGEFGSALQAASAEGHDTIVQRLLKGGAVQFQ